MKKKFLTLLFGVYQVFLFGQYDCPYPIIFVHGINSDHTTWQTTLNQLNPYLGSSQVLTFNLNASTSTLYSDDVVWVTDPNTVSNSCIYTINFNAQAGMGTQSASNEASIVKQGYALKLAIEKVIAVTQKEKVVLVGHSMGGLASRDYLQRWATANNHHVAKLLTIGTPHLGANIAQYSLPGGPTSLFSDPACEASRDLSNSVWTGLFNSVPGPYLYGGDENTPYYLSQGPALINFHNNDINCDGYPIDIITGINQATYDNPLMPLPPDVKYSYYVTNLLAIGGDGVVDDVAAWLYKNGTSPGNGSTGDFNAGKNIPVPWDGVDHRRSDRFSKNFVGHFGPGSILGQTEDYKNIVRGIDEGDFPFYAYKIEVDKQYTALSQKRADKVALNSNITILSSTATNDPLVDGDWYKFIYTGSSQEIFAITLNKPVSKYFKVDVFDFASITNVFENSSLTPIQTGESFGNTGSQLRVNIGQLTPNQVYYIRITSKVNEAENVIIPYNFKIHPLSIAVPAISSNHKPKFDSPLKGGLIRIIQDGEPEYLPAQNAWRLNLRAYNGYFEDYQIYKTSYSACGFSSNDLIVEIAAREADVASIFKTFSAYTGSFGVPDTYSEKFSVIVKFQENSGFYIEFSQYSDAEVLATILTPFIEPVISTVTLAIPEFKDRITEKQIKAIFRIAREKLKELKNDPLLIGYPQNITVEDAISLALFIQNNLSQPIKDIIGEAFLEAIQEDLELAEFIAEAINSSNINAFILDKVTEKFEEAFISAGGQLAISITSAVLEASLGGFDLKNNQGLKYCLPVEFEDNKPFMQSISPANTGETQNGTIELSWVASDPDNDALVYDLFVKEPNAAGFVEVLNNTSQTSWTFLANTSGLYEWYVRVHYPFNSAVYDISPIGKFKHDCNLNAIDVSNSTYTMGINNSDDKYDLIVDLTGTFNTAITYNTNYIVNGVSATVSQNDIILTPTSLNFIVQNLPKDQEIQFVIDNGCSSYAAGYRPFPKLSLAKDESTCLVHYELTEIATDGNTSIKINELPANLVNAGDTYTNYYGNKGLNHIAIEYTKTNSPVTYVYVESITCVNENFICPMMDIDYNFEESDVLDVSISLHNDDQLIYFENQDEKKYLVYSSSSGTNNGLQGNFDYFGYGSPKANFIVSTASQSYGCNNQSLIDELIPLALAFMSGDMKEVEAILEKAKSCNWSPPTSAQNNRTANFSTNDLPSAVQILLNDLYYYHVHEKSLIGKDLEIFGGLTTSEDFIEIKSLFQPFILNSTAISSNDSLTIINELSEFGLDIHIISNLIKRWNESITCWSNGRLEPDYFCFDIIIKTNLMYHDSIVAASLAYAASKGKTLTKLYNDAIAGIKAYSLENDPTQNAVCASTSIALSQKLTMTREAFEGTLKVFNGSVTDQMDSIKLDLVILNEQGVVSNDLFEIDTSALELITAIDGTGTLAANAEGTAKIIFIPEIGAAPTIPKYYSFGGSLSYRDPFSGLSTTMPLVPVTLQVNPSPNLYLHYFLQRDIISDDPLTSPIEPTIPASLGLMIENNGYGIATNLKIQSAQPQVIDNEKGLALNMNFTGSIIQGQPANIGLTNINFGNINPLSTKVGEWIFTSNVLGHFTGYQTSVRHLSSRGNPDLSLVEGASLHEWIKSIKVYDIQSDGINDFLVNEVPDADDHPDAIYLSQGNQVLDVEYAQAGSFLTPITYPTFTNTLTVDPSDVGWNYLKLNDPGHGDYNLLSVTRNQDNQDIPLDNAWLTFVTIPDTRVPVYEHKFHFVDVFADTLPKTYTVVWSPKDPTPPYVDTIIGAPLQVSAAKVNQLKVVFSEEIVDSTFTIADIALYNQGGPNLIDTLVTITKVDSVTYTIDITPKTNTNGYFVFKVETIGIIDLSGTPGFYAKQVGWTQFLTVPVITDYIDFPLRGISAAYDTVKIKFNLPLDTAFIHANDFFLVKDGNQLNGTMGLSLASSDFKTFQLTHMDTLFIEDGLYALGVDLKSIKSTTNIFGLDTQYYAFIVDNQRPDVDTLIKLYTGSLDPQHVTGIKVIFDEDIVSFDTTSVTLYRGLSAQGLSPMDVIEVSPKEYDVLWKLDASYANGSYKFVIDESKFKDLTLISGLGLDSLSWITDRNSNLLFTNVNIVPDYGFSDTDGITFNSVGNLQFSINENASNIRLYQQDNTNALTLLSSLASGAANVTLTMPYAVESGGNTKLVLKAYDQYQNEVSYTQSILIDQIALQASWALPQNLSFVEHPDSININFNRRMLDYTPSVYSTLSLYKDNVEISSASLEITEINDSTYRVNGFSTIANEPGNYKLSFKIDSFAKYLSGLPGSGNVDLHWEIANSNLVPIANAGPDLTIKDLGQVTLDGSLSSDPNGDSLSYLWYSLDDIPLSNDSVINPSLIVNESHLGKVLTFLLVVNDGSYTASDLVRIYIQLDDIFLRPKVFLEGPFSSSTGMMSDQLRQLDVIPLQNPYIDTLKYLLGNDGKFIDTTILEITGNNAVVDWVYLELYNATLDSIVRGGGFLLQRDGDIVDVDNVSTVKFLDISPQHNHRLRIYHRNHLPVETSAELILHFSAIQNVDLRYDLSSIKGQLNGVKKIGQYLTMFAGDINQNKQVQNTDLNLVFSKIGQAGYKIEDANMDGTVEQVDIQLKMIPNLGRGKQF